MRLRTELVTATVSKLEMQNRALSESACIGTKTQLQLTCACTRTPFVVQQGDSKFSCKHCAGKQTPCLAH